MNEAAAVESLELARPWVLWALLLLPPLAFYRLRRLRRDGLAYPPLQTAARQRRGLPPWTALLVEVALVATVLLGLAGPHRFIRLDLIEDDGVDVALVLDVSTSMLAEDFPPSRLEALKVLARQFVSRAGGNRIGIVIFAGDTYVQSPLTTDHQSVLELLASVTAYTLDQAKSGGTAIGDALLVATSTLERSRVEGRDQAVVLITDGESNQGIDPVLAGRYVAQQGMRLYAIGIGGEEPVEVYFDGERVGGDQPYLAVLDDSQLQALTEAAGGRYYRASEVDTLAEIFGELSRLESAPLEVRPMEFRHPVTNWLALASLVLFGAVLTLDGVVLRRPLR